MNILDNIKSPEELLEYMNKNITYGFVDKDGNKYFDTNSKAWNKYIIQNGEEVLKSKTGTCWDQVELERLWFERNNYNFKTIFIWFELNHENNLPTHTFLIYEKDNKYYWFEHAFEKYKGIHKFESEKEAIEYVKDKQVEYVGNNINKQSLIAYEYSKPKDNLSTEKYLEHVTSKKYIK